MAITKKKTPSITLWIKDIKKKTCRKLVTTKRMRIYFYLQAEKKLDFMFRVRVRYSKMYNNETDWQTAKETEKAFRAFMEKDLIEEFC